MSDTSFPIFGTDSIPIVGRRALLTGIWTKLTKTSPDNLSIVGPKSIGKTVLLNAIVERALQSDSPYALVIYWQLGYAPPQSDDEFVSQLCDKLYSAMGADTVTYKDHRDELQSEKSLPVLKEVMDLLQMEERPVLMIWDGFDKPLSQGYLSGQLFGNLRDLFYGKPHRVVTATRATQTELARSVQVEDSPFWNMFDVAPVRIGPFDGKDMDDALTSASVKLNQGGRKELGNWTGGHPVILFTFLNGLMATGNTEFTNEHVNAMASSIASELSDFLDKTWSDCSATAKNAYQLIVESDGIEQERLGKEEARSLLFQGFVVREGTKIKSSCRLLEQHVHGSRPDNGTLERMFGNWGAYRNEIRSILELRLKQIRPVDARLYRLVKRAIEDIPEHSNDCLNNLNFIEDAALDIIWKYEFGTDNSIPQHLVTYWTQHPRDKDFIIKERMELNDWQRPTKPFDQLKILQRLTGCTEAFDSKAKSISKDCYVLLNAIHAFRNRTVHPEGQVINEGVAVSALLLCIELLSCLERELTCGMGLVS